MTTRPDNYVSDHNLSLINTIDRICQTMARDNVRELEVEWNQHSYEESRVKLRIKR